MHNLSQSVGHLCSARHVPELVLKRVLHGVVLVLHIQQLVDIALVLDLSPMQKLPFVRLQLMLCIYLLLHVPHRLRRRPS